MLKSGEWLWLHVSASSLTNANMHHSSCHRRAKQVLLTEAIEELQRKVKKGKGINKEIIKDRQSKVRTLMLAANQLNTSTQFLHLFASAACRSRR